MNERDTQVLKQYGLETAGLRRGRGAWICDTSEGLRLLCEYKGSEKRVMLEQQILSRVNQSGVLQTDLYVPNQNGKLITGMPDGTKYVVKIWFQEKETDLSNPVSACESAKTTALLHGLLREIDLEENWLMGSVDLPAESDQLTRHNGELRRGRNYIGKKNNKSQFEKNVLEQYEYYYDKAEQAVIQMKQLEQKKHFRNLCHGSMDQHHILEGGRQRIVVGFHAMHLGNQMIDLYRLLRKTMEKHDWDVKLAASMMRAYSQICPLAEEQTEFLRCLFLYPEKYWKQVNYYLNSSKGWLTDRSVEKLRAIEASEEKKLTFMEQFDHVCDG